MEPSTTPAPYRAVWILIVVAFFVCFAFWASRIGNSLGSDQAAAPIPIPLATSAPHIATLYSNIGPPNPASLCAEVSPTPKQVTVESTSGVVIETVQCTK